MAPDPQRPLHILLASSLYPPLATGGAELVAQYLAEELVRRGHRVTVVSTCPKGDEAEAEERNGVEVIRFFPRNLYWGYERRARPVAMRMLWHVRDAWNTSAAERFGRIIRDNRPDVMHSHLTAGFSPAIWGMAKRADIPTVHTAHDYQIACPRATLLTRRGSICTNPNIGCRAFRSWHLSRAGDIDVFCSPSRFLMDRFLELGLKAGRTRVVNNGIPLPKADPPRDRVGAKRLELLFVARLSAEKGTLVVLDAMRRLPADLPVHLTVMGKGPLEPAVKSAAINDNRISFRGYLQGEEKRRAFLNADGLMLASLWYETAGLVLLEAASHGVAVIATRMGGIPEFMVEGQTGLLVPPGDAEALAVAIMRLATDTDFRERCRLNGPPFARQFSLERMTDEYLEVYRSVVRK